MPAKTYSCARRTTTRVPTVPARCAKGEVKTHKGIKYRSTRRVVNGRTQYYWRKISCEKEGQRPKRYYRKRKDGTRATYYRCVNKKTTKRTTKKKSTARACTPASCAPGRKAPVALAAANKGKVMTGRGGKYKSTRYMQRKPNSTSKHAVWRWKKID